MDDELILDADVSPAVLQDIIEKVSSGDYVLKITLEKADVSDASMVELS